MKGTIFWYIRLRGVISQKRVLFLTWNIGFEILTTVVMNGAIFWYIRLHGVISQNVLKNVYE
jgi:hypothetical protein